MNIVQILQTELTTDPLARGYAGMSDQEAADALNVANRERIRPTMRGSEIAEAIAEADWDALTAGNKQLVLALAGVDAVDPQGFAARMLTKIFTAQSATIQALAQARKETVTRAQELGLGFINGGDVKQARGR